MAPIDQPKAEDAPKFSAEKPPGESLSLRESIQRSISLLDKNPAFSDEEREIERKALEQLQNIYQVNLETIERESTRPQLALLQQEIEQGIEKYGSEASLNRTDIIDLSETLGGIFHRIEIENTIKKIGGTLKDRPGFERVGQEIETVGDLRKLPVETLIKLEDAHEGILLYAFTDVARNDTKVNLQDFYWTPQEGTRLRVDFRGNREAEDKIGAADLLPPSVRCITRYERGNTTLARTSTRRLGLKGRNLYGTGFFDDRGYIPVYSGDILIVGGADKAGAAAIDQNFEKKYRKQNNALDYEAYEKDHAVDEKRVVDDYQGRGLRVRKEYTQADLGRLEASIEASGIRHDLINVAVDFLKNKTPGDHCWDWVEKIYKQVEAKRVNVYRDHNYMHDLKRGDPGFDDNPENPEAVHSLEPGDWIIIHNRNNSDSKGNHSVLFMKWIDKENLIAEAASCPHAGCGGRVHEVDFKKTPVTWISKPTES